MWEHFVQIIAFMADTCHKEIKCFSSVVEVRSLECACVNILGMSCSKTEDAVVLVRKCFLGVSPLARASQLAIIQAFLRCVCAVALFMCFTKLVFVSSLSLKGFLFVIAPIKLNIV